MTEEEWLACGDPAALLAALGSGYSDRKYVLFAVRCFTLVPRRRSKEPSPFEAHLWRVAEQYADGEIPAAEVGKRGWGAGPNDGEKPGASWPTRPREWAAAWASRRRQRGMRYPAAPVMADALRDIFGNPFRPARVDPARLTAEGTALAVAAYNERLMPEWILDNARLRALADALAGTGGADVSTLEHLRSPGPHARGCWALDLLLGKE